MHYSNVEVNRKILIPILSTFTKKLKFFQIKKRNILGKVTGHPKFNFWGGNRKLTSIRPALIYIYKRVARFFLFFCNQAPDQTTGPIDLKFGPYMYYGP